MMILKAVNIRKSFAHPATNTVLNGVDLELARGTSAAIMGRSGEGKSTLLHILGTLEEATTGSLSIAGLEVGSSNRDLLRSRHIGFLFQSFHLLNDYTVLENVLMPARIARDSVHRGSPAHTRALSLLERVGLSDRTHFLVKLLSGGEKQRVALARALCNDPDILFADEPSGNLDRQTARGIHELLLSLPAEGKTVVVVTHDQELVNLCSERYFLRDGLLVR